MLESLPQAPEEALEAACDWLAGQDAGDCLLASHAVPLHRVDADGPSAFAGWLFPVFRDEEVVLVAAVSPAMEAGPWRWSGPFPEALFLAFGAADGMGVACRLDAVEVHGRFAALRVRGDHDTFVSLHGPRLVSAPEFAALARDALEADEPEEAG